MITRQKTQPRQQKILIQKSQKTQEQSKIQQDFDQIQELNNKPQIKTKQKQDYQINSSIIEEKESEFSKEYQSLQDQQKFIKIEKNQEPRSKILDWIQYILMIMFLAISLILSGNLCQIFYEDHLVKPIEDYGILENIILNLASPPIIDIHSAEDPVNILKLYRDEQSYKEIPNKLNEDSDKFQKYNRNNIKQQSSDKSLKRGFYKRAKKISKENEERKKEEIKQKEKEVTKEFQDQDQKRNSFEVAQDLNYNFDVPSHCLFGFQQISFGIWHGIKEGCICEDRSIFENESCKIRGKICKKINRILDQSLYYWRNKKICIKTSQTWKWVGSENCENNQKMCSPGLCISKHEECPITGLIKASSTDENNLYARQIDIQKKFNIQSHINSLPIIGFAITPGFGQAPCYNKKVAPLFESKLFFPLSKVPEKGCEMMKNYVIPLDILTKSQVFHENKIEKYIEDIPFWDYFSRDETDHFELQAIRRIEIGLHSKCDHINPRYLTQLIEISDQLHYISKWASILILMISSITLLLGVIMHFSRSQHSEISSEISQTKIIFWISLICSSLFIILGFFYLHHVEYQNGLKQYHTYFEKFLIHECFIDKPFQETFLRIDEFATNVYLKTELCIKIGLLISFIFIIVSFGIMFIQKSGDSHTPCQDPWE